MFHIHSFENGLVLLAEAMPACESVACSLRVPCGVNDDAAERAGLAEMLCDMSLRGAGRYDERQLVAALENLGCERNESVGAVHTTYEMAMLAAHLHDAVDILADIVRRPHLPPGGLEESRTILLNEQLSLQDDPARLAFLELKRCFYPDPWGRSSLGNADSVSLVTLDDLHVAHDRLFRPNGAILSVAGRFDWPRLLEQVGMLFGDWPRREVPLLVERPRETTLLHVSAETEQTEIAVAYPSVPFTHPDYLKAWSSAGILSGGMSCRLFREVREKRGLCYSVGASYTSLPHLGAVFCQCGTGNDRAGEALEVILRELDRLADGVEPEELDRLKIRARSILVMQQESTAARCDAIARDWYYLGRLRTLREIEEAVLALTKEEIDAYLKEHPAGPYTIVTLGPEQ